MRYATKYCSRSIQLIDGGIQFTYTGRCIVTGKEHSVTITGDNLAAYESGLNIQDAMPNVAIGDREFLQSGISPEGWALTFKKEIEDGDV
jgi:hypothetical protein